MESYKVIGEASGNIQEKTNLYPATFKYYVLSLSNVYYVFGEVDIKPIRMTIPFVMKFEKEYQIKHNVYRTPSPNHIFEKIDPRKGNWSYQEYFTFDNLFQDLEKIITRQPNTKNFETYDTPLKDLLDSRLILYKEFTFGKTRSPTSIIREDKDKLMKQHYENNELHIESHDNY